jgi:hypothetical protein
VTNSLVEVLYQVLLFIRGSTAMFCACFAKVAYYCWLTAHFAVLICLNFIRWEERIREGCRVRLQLMPIYTFSDFASTKRHIIFFTLFSKVSVKILLDEENENIMSCGYKFLSVAIFPENLINSGY